MNLDYEDLADKLRAWISEPEHYNVIHFCVEAGLSKDQLLRYGGESECLQEALDFAWTVMEWKVSEGALSSAMDRSVALKMLETYSGWKGDVNILQKNEYRSYMNEAQRKAGEILNQIATEGEGIESIEGIEGIESTYTEVPKNFRKELTELTELTELDITDPNEEDK